MTPNSSTTGVATTGVGVAFAVAVAAKVGLGASLAGAVGGAVSRRLLGVAVGKRAGVQAANSSSPHPRQRIFESLNLIQFQVYYNCCLVPLRPGVERGDRSYNSGFHAQLTHRSNV